MKNFVLLLILMLPWLTGYPQKKKAVSGYLGNRLSIGAGVNFCNSSEPQQQTDHLRFQSDWFSVNLIYTASMEYTVRENFNFGINAGYSSTSTFLNVNSQDELYWYSQDTAGESVRNTVNYIVGTPDIRLHQYGFYGKWFKLKKGSLAPIGRYFIAGMNANVLKYDYRNLKYHSYWQTPTYSTRYSVLVIDDGTNQVIYPEIFFALGYALPVTDRWLLDLSIRSGLMLRANNFNATRPGTLTETLIEERVSRMLLFNYSVILRGLL